MFGHAPVATMRLVDAETQIFADMRARSGSRSPDEEIAMLAQRQHGVVSRRQLLDLGLGSRAIAHRLERHRLHRLHLGVYAVGHRVLTREGHYMAAVLAGGPTAVLSHRSAAALWGIRGTAAARVEITVPKRTRTRAGLRASEARLEPDEITIQHGIPITTPPRTLLDLATVLTPHQLERALDRAEHLRLTDPLPLRALVARHAGRRGTKALKKILEARTEPILTRSDLEDRFLAFLDRHGIDRPALNTRVGPYEVDAHWPASALIVELDGFETHGTREAFERDRARDRALQAAGHRVVRITWRQLRDDAATLASQLRDLH